MSSIESRFQIAAVVDQIPMACDFVAQAARQAGLDDRAVYHCQLAVDEACTNIIEHGFSFQGGGETIDVICRQTQQQFSITISDSSAPYDPLSRPDPNPATRLEDRATGGWGVFFIKKLMDEVRYEYRGGRNHLTVIKHLRT